MSARRKSSVNIQANRQQRNPLNNFNIKSEVLRNEAKGTKPTCEAASVKDVLVMALLHLCKKAIFYDVRLKVGLYMLSLFIISLIGGELTLTDVTSGIAGSSPSPCRLHTLPEIVFRAIRQFIQRVLRQTRLVLDASVLVAFPVFHQLHVMLR